MSGTFSVLRNNLISLGTLDSNGCSYRAACGIMRIMKGSLIVMKGLKQNSLYLLQGNTVTGAAPSTSSFDIDSDTTNLWHMRLRDMSERGMDVLSKQEFCRNEGIVWHRTVRKMPQQNGVAERMTRTLLERARCMLSNVRLLKEFWIEAINTTTYLINRSPSTAIDCKAPKEIWSGKHVNYENLRIFGCPAYAHVNDGKLEPRTKKCIFFGYASGVKMRMMVLILPKRMKNLRNSSITLPEIDRDEKFDLLKNMDYTGDLDRRRSLTGYIFTFLSCVIIWKATLHTIAALSTAEAEYIAATEAVKEAIWLKGLVGDMGLKQKSSTVYCDSQSAIHLTKN
ncbi:hypothetical protein RJ639_036517 [Escallonia herrerae]|uniref:Integrase catalytic domain-containing protein n=1 Tax=Escallonia herrerae TaxID=1293975 RepID=A0AA89BBX8_9ASTE|nr:hypothetical protein RJ639_036517 [Escallonia herrerae]